MLAWPCRYLARHGGAVLGLCGILFLWGGVFHALAIERRQAISGSVHDITNLSRAFAEHLDRSIKSVDDTLLYVRDVYAHDPARFDLAAWQRQKMFFLGDATTEIILIDKNGIAVGPDAAGQWLDYGRQAFFTVPRGAQADELFISQPEPGRVGGRWWIRLARRIIDPHGAFAGVVVASFDPAYLADFYASVDLGSQGLTAVTGADGVVRARLSAGHRDIGMSLAGTRLLADYARAPEGVLQEVSPVDGIARLYAYHAIKSYKLFVTVGIALTDVLADYQANRSTYLTLAAILSLLLLAVTVLIERHLYGLLRTREALRASEARYAQKSALLEATLENMSQGIIMVDADRRVQVCNTQAKQKLDLPDELMAGNPLFDDVINWQWQRGEFGEGTGRDETWLRRFVLSGGISNEAQTYERTRPNGVTLEIRSVPLQGGGVVRTYTDITLRRETEATLRAARDEADRAARAKAEFLAMMSHEIRSPLHGLLGLIELLREADLPAEEARMVELAHGSAASLLRILNDVLDFSKLDAGAVETLAEPTALRPFVAALAEPIELAAARKGLRFVLHLADDLPEWVAVDALRLRQILGNLLGNAIKFTRAGTVGLDVVTETDESGGARLRFVVRDTGIGMSPAGLARLFQPFSQADASTTKHFGGTGLGLSISRRLARMLGGDIAVSSREGEGSVFTLSLALVTAEATNQHREAATAAAAEDSVTGLRVLVAEDQETNRWLMQRQCDRLGVQAAIVENGSQALAAYAAWPFDVLVTDCHMPGMDGMALARLLRSAEARTGAPRLPILGLTADNTPAMRDKCLTAGMDEVLVKPITLLQLRQALRRAMTRQPDPDAPEPADAAEVIFDGSIFRELFDGMEDGGKAWLDTYLAAASEATNAILASAGDDDRNTVSATAHRLAGMSVSAGAMRLGALARRLEAMALRAPQAELQHHAAEIAATLETTRREIGDFIARQAILTE
jgi:signal transduction histidine kinase/DNA-binding NarL/FixJ family response regulator